MTFVSMVFVIISQTAKPSSLIIQEAQVEWHHYSKTKGR